jgi:phenylpyruvate tautomerase PptA (4-oxalocrotonate tautomerase family)
MPVVRVDLYRGFSSEYKRQLLASVHEALVFAFQIPDGDRNQILSEHDEENFERSAGRSRQVVIIEITAFHGRSKDAKRKLYRRLADNLAASPGIQPDDVLVYLVEPTRENWSVSDGKPADEVDLGFKVDV